MKVHVRANREINITLFYFCTCKHSTIYLAHWKVTYTMEINWRANDRHLVKTRMLKTTFYYIHGDWSVYICITICSIHEYTLKSHPTAVESWEKNTCYVSLMYLTRVYCVFSCNDWCYKFWQRSVTLEKQCVLVLCTAWWCRNMKTSVQYKLGLLIHCKCANSHMHHLSSFCLAEINWVITTIILWWIMNMNLMKVVGVSRHTLSFPRKTHKEPTSYRIIITFITFGIHYNHLGAGKVLKANFRSHNGFASCFFGGRFGMRPSEHVE